MTKQRSEWAKKRIQEAREKSQSIRPADSVPEHQAEDLLAECREAFPGLLQNQITITTPKMLWKAKYLILRCEGLYEYLTGKTQYSIVLWRRALEKIKLDCFVTYGIEPGSNQDWERVGVALEKSLKDHPAQEPEAIGIEDHEEWSRLMTLTDIADRLYKNPNFTRKVRNHFKIGVDLIKEGHKNWRIRLGSLTKSEKKEIKKA